MDVVKGRQQTIWHTFNVAEAPKECFCDQMCVKYGDCCGDYAYRCPGNFSSFLILNRNFHRNFPFPFYFKNLSKL